MEPQENDPSESYDNRDPDFERVRRHLVELGWIDPDDQVEVLPGVTLKDRPYQSNAVDLYTDGKEICAMIGPDPVQGVAGYGSSVHEAL